MHHPIIDEQFYDQIIEIVPHTKYVGCTFVRCEFVGYGIPNMKQCRVYASTSRIKGAMGTWDDKGKWEPVE